MKAGKSFLLAVILVCVLSVGVNLSQLLWGQAVWGSITGYITDPSGSAIPSATIVAKNESTGVITTALSDVSGFYNITHLNPGLYTIEVNAKGFNRFIQQHVSLQVGATMRIDAKLPVGSVRETVTVNAASPLLNTAKTDVSENFASEQIQVLPVIQNNISHLFDLVPGVTKDTFQMGVGENPSQTDRVFVNGSWSGIQVFSLDGITDVDYGFSGIQIINPPQDSLQELKVTTADYDPEFSNTAGMVVQYVTKSGTNELHGSLYGYNQNSATFAADPFTEKVAGTGPRGQGIGVAPFNWNQDGFSLGGPIKKNKVFMFGDFQANRTVADSAIIATVPNADFRTGNFSALALTNPIFNPFTGNVDGTGRQQFSCGGTPNVICPQLISPVAERLLALLPLPNISQSTDNNFLGTQHETFNQNEFDLRNDWSASDSNKFFVRYSYYSTYLNNPPIFGVVAGGPTSGGLSPEVASTRGQQAAFNYTHNFGPNILNEFRAGFDRFHISALQSDSALNTDTEVGIPNINIPGNPLTGGLAGINVGGPVGTWFMGIPSGVGIPRFEGSTTYEVVDNVTLLHSNHQILAGADVQRQDFNFLSVNASSRGNFTFSPSITASPSVPNSGLGMAAFLLGLPSEFDRAIFTIFPGERQTRVGIYAQDIWHVRPKLTANLGLRWDKFTPITPAHPGGLANFDPASGKILLAGLGKVSNSANISTPNNDFGPRLGLAYRITQDTVFRAGFSTNYFESGYDATFYHLTSFFPIIAQQTINSVNIYQPIFPISQGPPSATPPSLPPSGELPAPNGTLLKTRPFNWKTETMYETNATIQRQLGPNATVSLAYVGTWASHLDYGYNMNAALPGAGPVVNRRPFFSLYGLSQPINMMCNCSTSNYNALQVGLTKRYSNNYMITSNFTWSKSLGYYGFFPPPYRNLDYGPGGGWVLANDRAAVWTLGHSIELPYGPGHHLGNTATGLRKFILAGWEFNGITVAASGLPVTPVIGNSAPLNADFGNLADRVAGVNPYNVPGGRNFTHWYNPAAFSAPAPFQIGNASPGMLRGPKAFTADLALWKNWKFKTPLSRENSELSFRWEVLNSTNFTNAGTPNGNAFSTATPVDSPVAGQITSLEAGYPMREMQFGLHLQW